MERTNAFSSIPPRTTDDLVLLANGFFGPRALIAAHRLGVFRAIGRGAMRPDEVARAVGSHPVATNVLLRALAGIGLLHGRDGRFELTGVAKRALLPEGDRYLGDYLSFKAHVWEAWSHLEHTLETGTAPPVKAMNTLEGQLAFVRGMHCVALGNAPILAEGVDLSGRLQLLDLGGGPGTYAMRFLSRYPDLRATIMDRPDVIGFARQLTEEMGLSGRVEFLEGDFHADPLGGPYDVVLLSHVIHSLATKEIRRLLKRASEALVPGGLLVLHDFFLNREGTRPRFAALFGLNRLALGSGRAYRFEDVRGWLEQLDLQDIRWRDMGEPRGISVVTASRPY